MRTSKIFVMAAAFAVVVAMASCDKDNGGETNEPKAVRFSATVGEQAILQNGGTRAAGTAWANDDAIGVFMLDNEWNVISENNKFTTTGDGNFTAAAGDEIYYPMDGSKVAFGAYYPYMSGVTAASAVDFAIETVQTAQNQPEFDLMWAQTALAYSKTDGAVDLQFAHMLTRLTMKTVAGTGVNAADLAGMTVTMKGIMTKRTFSPGGGSFVGPATDPADVTPRTVTDGSVYDAIILPHNYGSGTVTVEFTLAGGDTFVWNADDLGSAMAGNEYIYTVTLARTGVTATATILPWTTNDRGPVTAE